MILKKTPRFDKNRSRFFGRGKGGGKAGVKEWGWEVARLKSSDGTESSGNPILLATPLGNALQWRDPSGNLVAISCTSSSGDESLEIIEGIGMEKSDLDAIVAIWISRLWREGRELWHIEDQKKNRQAKEKLHKESSIEGSIRNADWSSYSGWQCAWILK